MEGTAVPLINKLNYKNCSTARPVQPQPQWTAHGCM